MTEYWVKSIQSAIVVVGLYLSLPVSLLLPLVFVPRSLSPLAASSSRGSLDADRSAEATLVSTPETTSSYYSAFVASRPTRLVIYLRYRQVVVYNGRIPLKRYAIAVGRQGWETPAGEFKVQQLRQNPTWINPLTGESKPGGHPDNPLGSYWIGFWTDGRNWIGFHGTPEPETVGQATSHGCIRMYNEDIEELFHHIEMGTPVTVIP